MISRRNALKAVGLATAATIMPITAFGMPANHLNSTQHLDIFQSACQHLDLFLHDEPSIRELAEVPSINNRIAKTLKKFNLEYDAPSTNRFRKLMYEYGERAKWQKTTPFLAAVTKCNTYFSMVPDYWFITEVHPIREILTNNDVVFEDVLQNPVKTQIVCRKYQFPPPEDADIVEKCSYNNAIEHFSLRRMDGKKFSYNSGMIGGSETESKTRMLTTRLIMSLPSKGFNLHALWAWMKEIQYSSSVPIASYAIEDKNNVWWEVRYSRKA